MHFFKKLDKKFFDILRMTALGLIALVVIVFVVSFLGNTVKPFLEKGVRSGISRVVPGIPAYDSVSSYAEKDASYGMGMGGESVKLSTRNVIAPPIPGGGYTTGVTAEDFEVTEYNATVETRHRERDCAAVTGLKEREYIIFENANEYDKGCSYAFKVAHKNVPEVLAFIKGLDPKDFSENTYTIKRQIDDYTSEGDILKSKLASIDDTLRSALRAYDEVTSLATRTENAEALAKIIDSKIGVIERLSQERINTTVQLERLARAKADQLDRLLYTYFYVTIYENKFVDGEDIADSWKAAIKDFVRTVNQAVQDITVNLLGLLFLLAQYALYFLVLLLVAKYGWRVAKDIWRK